MTTQESTTRELICQLVRRQENLSRLGATYEDTRQRLTDEEANALLQEMLDHRLEIARLEQIIQASMPPDDDPPPAPQLLCGGLLRWLMRPPDYKKFVETQIADMHTEYYQCIRRNDARGARLAIVRGHIHAIPSWFWIMLVRVISRVIEWIRA